jgi:hypothetical protein
VAYTGVKPGVLGVTVAWLVGVLSDELVTGVTLMAFEFPSVQVKGPTRDVMSVPLLNAFACRVTTWFVDRHPATGVKVTLQAAGMIC